MPKAFSPQDHYFHLAKKQGYRARSAFKLEEILQKFPRLVQKGNTVLDLGAAPGSFLQVLSHKVGTSGKIIGVDLQAIEPLSQSAGNVQYIEGDIFAPETEAQILKLCTGKVDVVTSDMAPKTSGIKDVDQWKSIELNQRVLELCHKLLLPGGDLITKIFVGADFQEFWKDEFQPFFKSSKTYKPKACRDRSFETFLIGEGFKSF